MKISITSIGRDKAVHLSLRDANWLIERMKKDTQSGIVTRFREDVRQGNELSIQIGKERLPHVYPMIELKREKNETIEVNRFNGLILLEVRGVASSGELERLKQLAMDVPSTWAAFVGASGQTVKLLVSVCRSDGSYPQDETEASVFYRQAYYRLLSIYDAALGRNITRIEPNLRKAILMPLDKSPLFNTNATPFRINDDGRINIENEDEHLLAQTMPVERQLDFDMERYSTYEIAYRQADEEAMRQVESEGLKMPVVLYPETIQAYLTALALQLRRRRIPQEEAVCHIWNHWRFKSGTGVTEGLVRSITEAVYAETLPARQLLPEPGSNSKLMKEIIRRMQERYVFRYNKLMGYTEYHPNHTWLVSWKPVTDRVINTLTTDLQLSDLPVWDRDVKRYIFSTYVPEYNPIEEHLYNIKVKWDGRDHIGQLAHTVPTDIPDKWCQWFHTWFLAMVAQWMGRNPHFGNSIVPLLISEQGYHKSTFCRHLLPPELASWGYTDHLSLSEARSVHLAMSQMLLINLDEFNAIPARIQEGFLKNIVQLPNVKVKRPYARHVEEVPRLASFIATTNMSDVLSDPSGSRRFIGIHVNGQIDVSHHPNYAQLYAQALAELKSGAQCWFDEEETRRIMLHNQNFRLRMDAEGFFHEYFELAKEGDPNAEWLTTANILMYIKSCARGSFQMPPANRFGRVLTAMPSMVHKTTSHGEVYLLIRKE